MVMTGYAVLDLLVRWGVRDALINLHHQPDAVFGHEADELNVHIQGRVSGYHMGHELNTFPLTQDPVNIIGHLPPPF